MWHHFSKQKHEGAPPEWPGIHQRNEGHWENQPNNHGNSGSGLHLLNSIISYDWIKRCNRRISERYKIQTKSSSLHSDGGVHLEIQVIREFNQSSPPRPEIWAFWNRKIRSATHSYRSEK